LFVIVSSENLPTSEILPLYYTRQQVEQVFDVSKNNADIMCLLASMRAARGSSYGRRPRIALDPIWTIQQPRHPIRAGLTGHPAVPH